MLHRSISRTLRIEPAVATAFLNAPDFHHGARSIEAIVEMSRLSGYKQFESSSLPPETQLTEHVNAAAFKRLLTLPQLPEATIETIAQQIHKNYLAAELKKGSTLGQRPALRHRSGDVA